MIWIIDTVTQETDAAQYNTVAQNKWSNIN